MCRRREIALLLSPFFASALICETYFATLGGRPCGRPSVQRQLFLPLVLPQ
jgi:hypothetical protein